MVSIKLLVPAVLWTVLALMASGQVVAQGVWRCGNDYTNQPVASQHCQRLESSTITVIEGTRVQQSGALQAPPTLPVAQTAAPSGRAQVPASEQYRRDARSRQILQTELDKVLSQQSSLRAQWMQADASEKAKLRLPLEQLDADVAALQREIAK